MRELEIYSQIEPIGGLMEISRPAEKPAAMNEDEATAMFNRIARSLSRKRD